MTPPSAAAHSRQRIRRGSAPRVPRRVAGPAARPRVATAGAVALPGAPRLGLPRPLRRLAALPDARVLDRLLTGRVWIGFVAFALIGIVFMQVSLLKLNAGIGRAVEQAQSLERGNADLRAQVSQLGSNDRIQQVAERLGLELPPAGAVTFLGKDGQRMGGDGVTALAVGTQTGPAPAGTGAGATAAGAGSVLPTPTATPTAAAPPAAPSPTATTATAPAAPVAATPAVTPAATATPVGPPPQRTTPATPAGGATAPTG